MKGPPSDSPPRQPLQLRDSQRRRCLEPQRDSGTYEQPNPLTPGECPAVAAEAWEKGDTEPPLRLQSPVVHLLQWWAELVSREEEDKAGDSIVTGCEMDSLRQ